MRSGGPGFTSGGKGSQVKPTPSFLNSSNIPDAGLLVQKFPGVGAVEHPDLNAGGVFATHHSRVDGNPAINVLLNTFIVGSAATGFAVIELNAFIIPKIGRSGLWQTADTDLLAGVIGPLRADAMTNGAGALC